MAGSLSKYSPSLRDAFLQASTVPEVTSLMEAFKKAVAEGTEKEQGWPSAAYAVSKAGVTGMTRALAKQEAESKKNDSDGLRLINACCPGWVVTDMTKGKGRKTPDQGAQTPVLLALGDIGSQMGLFWQNEKPIDW
jgi:carbonyl reductase 1